MSEKLKAQTRVACSAWLADESTTYKNMALEDHAKVEHDGFKVPPLGIPPDAVLQECELCHNEYPLRDVEMTSTGQVLCIKCRAAESANDKLCREVGAKDL